VTHVTHPPRGERFSVKTLARRNAVELRNSQFGADADRLIGKIAQVVKKGHARLGWWQIAAGIVAAILLAWAALAVGPIAEWRHSLFNQKSAIEKCDGSLGPVVQGLDYSGVFAGIVVDGGQGGGADVQLKLVRDRNAVRGSYLRAGICGSVSGEVTDNRLIFNWNWAGNSGRGTATQVGEGLSGGSGLRDAVEGAGTFVLFRKKPSSL
jgi:hypothetical protein